jgi:rhamnulokinase
VQARTAGVVEGDLAAMRSLLRETQPVVRYSPAGDQGQWRAAERRLGS